MCAATPMLVEPQDFRRSDQQLKLDNPTLSNGTQHGTLTLPERLLKNRLCSFAYVIT